MSTKTLSKKDVEHLAKLSALTLTEKEVEKYEKQLSETLDYVENLEELNTEKISEAHSVTNSIDVFFEDGEECKRQLDEKEVFANTKKSKNNQFVVERIL